MAKVNFFKKSSKKIVAVASTAIMTVTLISGITDNIQMQNTAYAAENQIIQNDVFWHDTDGNPIYSQGGGVFKFGDTYYWYGVKYNGALAYYKNPTKKVNDTGFLSVTCYSSKDLVNWKFENDVLTSKSKGFPGTYWFGRLGVAYNKNTKKYVLVAQNNESVLFASCSSPTGNFEVKNVQDYITNISKQGTGDQTIFIDDDGKAYLICSNKGGRGNQYVAPLRESDYLAAEPAVRVANGYGREGNCMFKYKGKYYFCASDLHGWNASHSYYMVADKITGPYSEWKVMPGTDEDFSHVTQTGFFVTVHGSEQETVLFCGDRWSDFAGNGHGYNQWCPLSFDGSKPFFNSLSQWEFDAETGLWEVGAGNNYILNPSFDADRVSQSTLAGWKNSGSGNGNASGARTGRFCMQQWSDSAFKGTMYQDITLPNQTYTLKAWVKSSGGQNQSKIYINGYGGEEKNVSIKDAGNSWKEITISDIEVTTGKCQVGIYSDSKAGNWVKVDDFTLIGDGSASQGINDTKKDYTNSESSMIYAKDTAISSDSYKTIGDTSLLSGISYTIKNKNSGMFLDVSGKKAIDGANIHQWTANGDSNQEWRIIAEENGYCRIMSMADESMCISVEGNDATDGLNVEIQPYTSKDNQLWKLIKNGSNYAIVSKCSGDKAGLDVYDMSTEKGGNINQWEYWEGDCQLWNITPVYPKVNSGKYTIKNLNSNKWISSESNGNVIQSDNSQPWSIAENSDGTYTITHDSNKALTVENGNGTDGNNISLSDSTGSTSQKFTFQCNKDGTYSILTVCSENSSSLDVYDISLESGANICQWEYWGGDGQKFIIEPAGRAKGIVGDVNDDNEVTVADLVMMEKFLLGNGSLTNWIAGDLCEDGVIDVFDIIEMRKLLIN